MKIVTVAEVPEELAQAWLQHLRDFDTAHPGCHFQVIADAPDIVNAANNHDALMKALRELVDYGGTLNGWDDARAYAKQVLASVGKGTNTMPTAKAVELVKVDPPLDFTALLAWTPEDET